MMEKRRFPRYVVEGMGIYAKTIFNNEVEVLDISVTGGSIRGTKRFTIGSDYSFKFEHGDKSISVKGVIVWEKLTGTKKIAEGEAMPIYTAGIDFKNGLTEKRMEELKALFIEKVKEQRLVGVKVSMHSPEKAVLSRLETCAVKDLSLGGMRIETSEEPGAGSVFSLELMLGQREDTIACEGRIAFYREIPEKPLRYTVGVEFRGMADGDKARLKRFIEVLPTDIGERASPEA